MKRHSSVQRFGALWVMFSMMASCALMPQPIAQTHLLPSSTPQDTQLLGASAQQASVRADDATPETITFPNKVTSQPVEEASSLPSVPATQVQALDFVTAAPTGQQIKMPANGSFQLIAIAGPSFQILDNDGTDGVAKVQLPSQTFDLYLRPEASSTTPVTCPTPTPTTATGIQLLDQIDQAVLAKANQLTAAGQGQCVYLPPSNQRQNANCNSTAMGFQCSGPLNKTLNAASCPEMAIYGGAMNINNALPTTKLFVAMQNNLTINQSVKGILSSRGDLNTNLNNSSQLNGVFVGARSNNLNLGGNAKIQGLYSILNNGSLSMNMNPSAIFEGELCTTGTANLNRNGSSQLIYNPNQVTPWQSDLSFVTEMMCVAGNKPYTQTIAMICPTPAPVTNGSVKIEDALYSINQTLSLSAGNPWYRMPGRPMPVPDTWFNSDKNQYVLTLSNAGLPQISSRWVTSQQVVFPVGIAEIGPNGGSVELPGVGKLTVLSGALNEKKVIRLIQEKSVTLPPSNYSPVTPPVRIEPVGLKFEKTFSAYVNLKIDLTQFIDGFPVTSMTYLNKTQLSPFGWMGLYRVIRPDSTSKFTLGMSDDFMVDVLSTIMAVAQKGVLKSFLTTAQPSPGTPCKEPAVYTPDLGHVFVECNDTLDQERIMIDESAEIAYSQFQEFQKQPLPVGALSLIDPALCEKEWVIKCQLSA